MSFIEELKRRNVIKIGGIYCAVAFGLVQVFPALVDAFDLPKWLNPALFLSLAAGFPLTLLVAWALEMTPERLRRTPPNIASMPSQTTLSHAASAPPRASHRHPPHIHVEPFRVLSDNDNVKAIAEGIRAEIDGALVRNSAITVLSADAGNTDFVVQGAIQSAGNRLWLSFTLVECSTSTKLWAERFDRQLEDLFGLEDAIVLSVTGSIRSRIKMVLFSQLRDTEDANLSVPELLNKAAGIFHVAALERSGLAVTSLRAAVARDPDNAMAHSLLGFALFRVAEYEPLALTPHASAEMLVQANRGVALDPRSYVARTVKALVAQDVQGDFHLARQLASEALAQNGHFAPALALLAICDIHLGSADIGLSPLRNAMAAGAEDASHPRWRRELAVAHWMVGDLAAGKLLATSLCEETPEVPRNVLVLIALQAASGEIKAAQQQMTALLARYPNLTLSSARLPRIHDVAASQRFAALLQDAGLGKSLGVRYSADPARAGAQQIALIAGRAPPVKNARPDPLPTEEIRHTAKGRTRMSKQPDDNRAHAAGDWAGADPFAPDFRDNPYPALNQLRERHPVNLTPVGTWRISRHDDISAIFKKAQTSMTLADGTAPNFDPEDTRGSFLEFMLNQDGPEHVRLRRLAMQSLGHNTARQMEAEVEQSVTQAMDQALKQGGMEIVGDLAHHVPSRMMCRIMGVPLQDRDLFNEWTAARTNAFFARFLPPEVQQRTRDAGHAMADYFEVLVRERRQRLGDDLISALIRAEEQGDKLRDGELIIQAIGIIIAGYETTIGLIGNGLRAFLDHPQQLALLRADPGLIQPAVEECLRYDTPILFNWRVLKAPYELAGTVLPAQAVLWLMLASGNHDPRHFDDPDTFNIQRTNVDHLAFGGGVHFCLGSQLARMEARHAIGQFAQRTAGLEIRAGQLAWSHSFFRVLASLPVSFH